MVAVFFEKPNHRLLSHFGKSQVDMHFHTRYSDSNVRVSKALKKARKLGIGIAITDHNEVKGALEAVDNDDGVMVIPGIEVSCREGPHILIYFYEPEGLKAFFENFIKEKRNGNPYMAIRATVEEVLKEAGQYKCIKVAAHPFGYMTANSGLLKTVKKGYISEKVLNELDGIEVICGAMNRYLNKKASIYADKYNFMATGGSDGHCLFQLGKVVTVAEGNTRQEFLDSIKKRCSVAIGKEPKPFTKLIPATSTIRNHVPYTIPTVKLQSMMMYERAKHFPGRVIKKCKTRRVLKHKDF